MAANGEGVSMKTAALAKASAASKYGGGNAAWRQASGGGIGNQPSATQRLLSGVSESVSAQRHACTLEDQ